MIAHHKQKLHRLWMHRQADTAVLRGRITLAECETIKGKYPTGQYSPNIFIRIGLFILATFAIGSAVTFTQLVFSFVEANNTMSILLIGWGVVCILILEFLIHKYAHYKSGLDDALEWNLAGNIFLGLTLLLHLPVSSNVLIGGVFTLLVFMRYTNAFMAVVSLICFSVFLGMEYTKNVSFGKSTISYVLLGLYVIIIVFTGRWKHAFAFRWYAPGLKIIQLAAMVAFYICGNYYIQQAFGIDLLYGIKSNASLSPLAAWLFKFLTIATPAFYIGKGILHKDALYLRTGLLLLIPTYFTYRFYYPLLPIEWEAILIGSLLVVLAYVLTRYLKQTRSGYSARPVKENPVQEQAEALLIAATLGDTGQAPVPPVTGGGSAGGGGATGHF